MNAMNPNVKNRLLAGFSYSFIDLLLRLTDDLFDSTRVNTAVGNQLLKR